MRSCYTRGDESKSARANVTSKVKDWVSVNLGLSASTSEQNAPTSSGSSYSNSSIWH